MPRFDYKCPTCGQTQEIDTHGLPDYLIEIECGTCPGRPLLERQPAAPAFNVRGFNARNGYSRDK